VPVIAEWLAAGEISGQAAGLVLGARATDPEAFDRTGEPLPEGARTLSTRDLPRAVSSWRQLAEAGRTSRGGSRHGGSTSHPYSRSVIRSHRSGPVGRSELEETGADPGRGRSASGRVTPA
jgi:hypothetical protein